MQEYTLPDAAFNIVAQAPGRLWFTMPEANAIGSLVITDTVTVRQYPIPTPNSQPYDLVYTNGAVWFTERTGNKLGRLDVNTGAMTEFPIPTPNSEPTGIAVAPDGKLWFCERGSSKIGQFDAVSLTFTELVYLQHLFLPVITTTNGAQREPQESEALPDNQPYAEFEKIAVGLDSTNQLAIWATAPNRNEVINLRLQASGVTFVPISTRGYPRPMGVVVDPQGQPWVTTQNGNFVMRYAFGTLTLWRLYGVPTPNASPAMIAFRATDEKWEFWFAEQSSGKVGQVLAQTSGAPISIRDQSLPNSAARPWGIAVDDHGQVWVAGGPSKTVTVWRPPYFTFTFFPTISRQEVNRQETGRQE
jgi:virginiamycin B lyase